MDKSKTLSIINIFYLIEYNYSFLRFWFLYRLFYINYYGTINYNYYFIYIYNFNIIKKIMSI